MPDKTATDAFVEKLRGKVLQPDDKEYHEARKLYNAMIDKHSRFIIGCANVSDVMTSVLCAREQGIETAIRSGGHNGPGLASVDQGLVIDCSQMKGIRIDPESRTVRVEAGNTWGDVDHAAHMAACCSSRAYKLHSPC